MNSTKSRYSSSRQKSCLQCSAAKAKCDRGVQGCERCSHRQLRCSYPQTSKNSPLDEVVTTEPCFGHISSPSDSTSAVPRANVLNFSDLNLVCPINAYDIQNRWLNNFVPVPGQKVKNYSNKIIAFLSRILRSYAAITVRGRGVPPFVHPLTALDAQLSRPLATCLNLVRLFDNVPSTSGQNATASQVLQREMAIVFEQRETYNDMTLLAAFQAYLIYSMVLLSWVSHDSQSYLQEAMMSLQELACSVARSGLVCQKEQQIPLASHLSWESWIVAESKRRTLYTMYLFDSLCSFQAGLPSYIGVELEGLLAPGAKSLWVSNTRQEWGSAYELYSRSWASGGLHIEELWPMPPSLDEEGVASRNERVDRWLEDIDEYGTMLYAVTSCTHGV